MMAILDSLMKKIPLLLERYSCMKMMQNVGFDKCNSLNHWLTLAKAKAR